MKATYWIVGVVVVIALAAGIWWSMQNKSVSDTATSTGTQSASQTQSSTGSLASLVARGGSWQCSVNSTSNGNTTSGTVYVSNGKVRGDFTSNTPQMGPVQSHMISDGTDVYVWSSAMPSGMKMKATQNSQSTTTRNGRPDYYNQNYDYNCSPWTKDATQFTLPAGITFNDMSALVPGAGASAGVKGTAGVPAGLNCAMCDQAPTAQAKASCKSALHCN